MACRVCDVHTAMTLHPAARLDSMPEGASSITTPAGSARGQHDVQRVRETAVVLTSRGRDAQPPCPRKVRRRVRLSVGDVVGRDEAEGREGDAAVREGRWCVHVRGWN